MKMNSPRRIRNNRAKWLLGFFLTVMVILIGRLAYVQIFDHARYVALAKNEVEKNEELYSPRGTIYDRNGNQLAISAISILFIFFCLFSVTGSQYKDLTITT